MSKRRKKKANRAQATAVEKVGANMNLSNESAEAEGGDYEKITDSTNNRADSTNEQIDSTNNRTDSTNARIDSANNRTDSTNNRTDTTNARIDSTKSPMNSTNPKESADGKRINYGDGVFLLAGLEYQNELSKHEKDEKNVKDSNDKDKQRHTESDSPKGQSGNVNQHTDGAKRQIDSTNQCLDSTNGQSDNANQHTDSANELVSSANGGLNSAKEMVSNTNVHADGTNQQKDNANGQDDNTSERANSDSQATSPHVDSENVMDKADAPTDSSDTASFDFADEIFGNATELPAKSAEWSSMERKVGPFETSLAGESRINPSELGEKMADPNENITAETAFITDIAYEKESNRGENSKRHYHKSDKGKSGNWGGKLRHNEPLDNRSGDSEADGCRSTDVKTEDNRSEYSEAENVKFNQNHTDSTKRQSDSRNESAGGTNHRSDSTNDSAGGTNHRSDSTNESAGGTNHRSNSKNESADSANHRLDSTNESADSANQHTDRTKSRLGRTNMKHSSTLRKEKAQRKSETTDTRNLGGGANAYGDTAAIGGNSANANGDTTAIGGNSANAYGDTAAIGGNSANAYGDTLAIGGSGGKKHDFEMRIRNIPSKAKELWHDYRRSAKLHVRSGAVGLALGLCSYLLGSCSLLFGISPLGIALLCASPVKIMWIFAGLCLSALSFDENTFIYIFAYATGIAVRILTRLLIDVPNPVSGGTLPCESEKSAFSTKLFSSRKDTQNTQKSDSTNANKVGSKLVERAIFNESIYLRMATGCACAFVIGLYALISKGFQYYDLFGAIFALLCTPLAIFIYSGCFKESGIDERFREMSISALLISLTYALRNMYLIGISGGAFFAFFITLYVVRQKGIIKGAILGLLCGLAYSPAYAPMFALFGLTAAALWNISAFGALCGSGCAAMMWGFYIEGVAAMSRILPAVMLSSVCYMGAQKLTIFPLAKDLLFSGRYCSELNELYIEKESKEAVQNKMLALSETFEGLSEIFYNLGDRMGRPDLPSLCRMCDGVYDRYCPFCPNKDLCWDIEYSKSKELLTNIGGKLEKKGIADIKDIPDYMRNRCLALPGIIGEINIGCRELCDKVKSQDKTEIFALDYSTVSALLRETELENRKEYKVDEDLTSKLSLVLAEYGFGDGGVCVYGQRRKKIIARGFDISGGGIGMSELKRSLERSCEFPLSDPVIEMKDNCLTLKMATKRKFSLKITTKTDKNPEEKCGDTVSVFESRDDRQYLLISDGMGCGERAAMTSMICSVFLKKLLTEGNRTSAVLKMLNNFVRSKPHECSCTLDLMEFDLLSGKAEFVKCGACTSFVRRGDNLIKLNVNTLPLGILTAVDAGRLSVDTEKGDYIIMMSDGVAQGAQDCIWLMELLTKGWEDNPQIMLKKLVEASRAHKSTDDISVAIVEVR